MPPTKTWVPPTARLAVISLCALIALNVIDALATIEIIGRGGEEGNPIMQPLFRISPSFFLFYKIGLILTCGAMLAWFAPSRRLAWRMLCLANCVYLAIAGLHVYLLMFV